MHNKCYKFIESIRKVIFKYTIILISVILLWNINSIHAATAIPIKVKPAINKTKPSLKVPVSRSKCPKVIVESFEIVGKVPVKKRGKKGQQRYRLRLQAIISNIGGNFPGRVVVADALLIEYPQGRRSKVLSRLHLKNLNAEKKLVIGALSRPLSLSTEFLPRFRVQFSQSDDLGKFTKFRKCLSKEKRSIFIHGDINTIQPREVLAALKR